MISTTQSKIIFLLLLMPESMPESTKIEANNMIPLEEHNLQLLKERVNTLLQNEKYDHALKDNIMFSFHRPKDLFTSDIFSLLLKPASGLKTLQAHKSMVLCVSFSPNNKLIASACEDKTVRLWNLPNGELTAELKGHERLFSPDGQSIVSGSADKTVRSVATKQQLQTLNGHSKDVCSVAWSPNGELIASGSSDTTVILWDAISGSIKQKLTDHKSYVWSVSFSQNGSKLASAGHDKTAIIWDVRSGAALIKFAPSSWVLSVCFSSDDQFLVTGCYDGIMRMFNANTGHEEKRFEGHTNFVLSVACSFDGFMIASGSSDKSVRFWDVASTKQLQKLHGHKYSITSVAFSRDGKFIVSGSDDKTVRLWNAPLLLKIASQPQE